MTKRVGIIGHPLGHSISPVFQQAAFNYLNIDAYYEIWEIEPDDIRKVLDGLRARDALGCNITVPYKETVMPMLDECDALCRRIGACNTIVNNSGKLMGYNTDADGFIKALLKYGDYPLFGKKVVILGSGGVARAAGFALLNAGIGSLTIAYDIQNQAENLAKDLRNVGGQIEIIESKELAGAVAGCDLLVNCTPFGMKATPLEGKSLVDAKDISSGILVYDVVYNPLKTQLLLNAEKAGADTLEGLAMLVYQGAAAFELWMGKDAPVDVMFEAALSAL
ncbi:shikimate dehydrogenase [Chloroflexota bacterium]